MTNMDNAYIRVIVKNIFRFTECVFEVPEEPAEGIWDPHRKKNLTDDQLRISVNHGNKEALVAMATIDMTDLTILVCKHICFLNILIARSY